MLRAAYGFGASMVAIEGDRTPMHSALDTPKAWRHLPVLRVEELKAVIPFNAVPATVDIVDDAVSFADFDHPAQAFYVLVAEMAPWGGASPIGVRSA